MSTATTTQASTTHPAMKPIPLGVPVPDAVREASNAYAEAREALAAAHDAHRAAQKRDMRSDHDYRAAVDQAVAAGVRRSDVQRPQQRTATTGPAYDAALTAALDAELAFADAIFSHRPGWLQGVEQSRSEADDHIAQLFRDLDVALRDKHALATLEKVLRGWHYDPELDPSSRLRILHKSQKPQHRPDFPAVTAEMDRNVVRMQHVRSAAARSY